MPQIDINKDEIEIDLLELLNVVLHWLWLIVLVGVITGAVGFVYSRYVITPMYESTTGIYVLNKNDSSNISYSDAQLSLQLTHDYIELIGSRYVLETVINECGLDTDYKALKGQLEVTNVKDTRILYITVKDTNPVRAQMIANEIREIASEHIKDVTEVEAVNVVDYANLPTKPCSPPIKKYTAIAMLIGMAFVTAVVVLKHLLDDTIKTEEDIEKHLGLVVLGIIPIVEDSKKGEKEKKYSKTVSKKINDITDPNNYLDSSGKRGGSNADI